MVLPLQLEDSSALDDMYYNFRIALVVIQKLQVDRAVMDMYSLYRRRNPSSHLAILVPSQMS